MIANIVIIILIIGYCIFLIYKAYKNHKEGKTCRMRRMWRQLRSCSGCSAAAGKSQYTKEKVKRGLEWEIQQVLCFYAFGAFLLIYLVGVSIYQIYLWIKKWREKQER